MAQSAELVGTANLAGAAGTMLLGNGDGGRASQIVVQVVGAMTGTITVQATMDNTTWVSTLAKPSSSTTAATTITGAGIYVIESSGYTDTRLSWPGGETGAPTVFRRPVVG